MRHVVCLLAVATVLFTACGGGGGTNASAPDKGDFVLTFEQALPADAAVAREVKESGVARDAIDGLNETYALPADINVIFTAADPDDEGPYYDEDANAIHFPYPSLTNDRALFKSHGYDTDQKADEAIDADVLFTLYHEVGHALIHNLDLPVTGKEEDAVDDLSAVVLTESDKNGQDVIVTAADWFSAVADSNDSAYDFGDFADTHSLDEQRFVTLLCLAYGSDPKDYGHLVSDDLVPQDRADGCPDEYAQAQHSWDTLLEQYTK